ncbi:MAG: B12-binding domain-containing radical SAM protein [Acidobacteriia bacterium]|nr:B12-binding domain-containing radical SAM protein [Terriglobia bacterium]
MVDVLLTHSYHLCYDRKQVHKMQPYPPLGTLYAAALLRQRGFTVALFDSMLEPPEQGFAEAVARTRPKVIAIYEDNFNFLSKMCLSRMREVAFAMLEGARSCGSKIVVNGSDATDHVLEYLERGADYVLLGEAEWTLLELTESLMSRSGRDAKQIAGLAYWDRRNDSLARTPARPLMRNLDLLPCPARDLVDIERYRNAWKQAHGFFSLNLVASRGCPYRCNWCAKPIYGDSFHARSPESVAEEMRQLREEFGAEHLWFADDLFGIQNRWVEEFAGKVEQRRAALPFKMQSRVDLMREETVAALARAGCTEVWMGVESGSQKILDAMEKGIRVEQIADARENLRQNGIRACFFLQFGYPGETWGDIQETIQLVRDTRPDDIGVSVSYPLPGTRFHERVREQLGKKTNWEDSDDLSMMFKGAYTSEFYRALRDALHAEVESWNERRTWAYSVRDRSRPYADDASACVPALWRTVEQLEMTCRNHDATQLPVLVCSAAD